MKTVVVDLGNGFDEYFGTAIMNLASLMRLPFLERQTKIFLRIWAYNFGHNILELYNVLTQGRLATSKMKLNI